MLVLHDGTGVFTGLQLFPESSEAPHIVADDDLYPLLEPFIHAALQLDSDGENYFIPVDILARLDQLNIEKYRSEKLAEIEKLQLNVLQSGVPFLFGDVQDIVQTRSERDLINISGITLRGMLLRANAVHEPVIEFRAQSNTSYLITGEQAIALGETVAQHNEAIYQKAWALKDAITSATTLAELEAVQW